MRLSSPRRAARTVSSRRNWHPDTSTLRGIPTQRRQSGARSEAETHTRASGAERSARVERGAVGVDEEPRQEAAALEVHPPERGLRQPEAVEGVAAAQVHRLEAGARLRVGCSMRAAGGR